MQLTKPRVPSTQITWIAETIPQVAPSFAETVAIPLTHDWGPLGSDAQGAAPLSGGVQLVTSFAEWTALYGASDTPGRSAVAGAFAGQGLPGSGGAGGVYVYRMGTGASAATAAVANAAATPGGAVTLTGKYKGTRGNRLSYAVNVDPGNAANDRLQILLDGAIVESYSYARTSIAALVTQVNTLSSYVQATLHAAGSALSYVTATALAGGTDGATTPGGAAAGVITLTASDWLAALGAFEYRPFTLLAPFDLTDGPTQAALFGWVQTQAVYNRPVMAVVGGAAGDTFSLAAARSATFNDPHIVNVGIGTWHDDLLGKDLSTSQLAPRIAGILASRGETKALTSAKIAGIHMVGQTGGSVDQIASAIASGVTTFIRTSSPDADIRIAAGRTTYTTNSNPAMPYEVFKDPRLVRVMDLFVRRMKVWGDDNIVGENPVGPDARAAVKGRGLTEIADLKRRGLILAGNAAQNIPDPFISVSDPQDPTLLDSIPFTFGWQFARTAEFVIGQGAIR